MKTILLIHGPNLNRLGVRDEVHYGRLTLKDIEQSTRDHAKKFNFDLIAYQSNHEGNLIDELQLKTTDIHGIIINPGALTHYSYALHDALLDTCLPAVEVHLSDLENREPWRKISVTAPACVKVISGKKEKGYIEAVSHLAEIIQNDKS